MTLFSNFLKSFLCLLLVLVVTGFSDIKQNEEYSCGPVCAANCVVNILNRNFDRDELVQTFTVLAKTDKNGTTAQNLCSAIEQFFNKTKLKTNIKYHGIRQVDRKYRMSTPINICNEFQKGNSVILNLGFYKQEGRVFVRKEGHYVNAYACKEGKILIADPYAKDKPPFYITLEKMNRLKIRNPKDNEKYSLKQYGLRKNGYYKVVPVFEYLTPDYTIFLNGTISIQPYFL